MLARLSWRQDKDLDLWFALAGGGPVSEHCWLAGLEVLHGEGCDVLARLDKMSQAASAFDESLKARHQANAV